VLDQLLLGDLDPVPLASAKRLPVGGITPFRAPRFVSSERRRMARVYPSAIIASTVMSRSGNCSSNHSAISEHVLGSVHPSWGLLRLGGAKKRQAPDHDPSLF
jgi:hypothetical protein